jgi:hypothetical protein
MNEKQKIFEHALAVCPDVEKTQKRINEVCNAMRDLLLEKNKRYGNSALEPLNIFSLQNSTNSIMIRIDDKLNRVKNRKTDKPKSNDVCDVIGYCFLLLVSMGVKADEILNQID